VTGRYLLDTNVLSEPARPEPHPEVMRRLGVHRHEIATAAPVWHELLFGCHRLPASARRRQLEHYLVEVLAPTLAILPYDDRAAVWHAAERARLATGGRMPAFVDGQIAAIAWVNDLILVTANVSDYVGFRDVIIGDWTSQRRRRS